MKQSQYSQKMVIIDLTKNQVEQWWSASPRGLPYKSDVGARRLQILVSLRLFGTEIKKQLNMLIHVSLRAVHKEICKKGRDADLTEISLKGR